MVLFSGSNVFADIKCQPMLRDQAVKECKIFLRSRELKYDSIFIKAWMPAVITDRTPVILFLHGRGYSQPSESDKPTMIEAVGLLEWMSTDTYKKNPAIIISPQDLFTREDGTVKGNDYWLGVHDRDWEGFMVQELKPYLERELHLQEKKWLAAGISMGGHGAMKMTIDHPEDFKAFVAMSPVFRSSVSEIHGSDKEVFLKAPSLESVSIGARLLTDESAWTKLKKTPHWIEIHQTDFALGEGFVDSKKIWNKLATPEYLKFSPVKPINDVELTHPGHSMEFWRLTVPKALNWLIKQDRDLKS